MPLPPKECLYDRAARQPGRAATAPILIFPGRLGLLQQFLDLPAKRGAVQRIGERKLDEGLKVARKIADVVAPLVGRQLDGKHALALFAHLRHGIGQLNFAARIWFHAPDHVEYQRRKNIAPRDRQIAWRLARLRLLHQVDYAQHIAIAVLYLDDAIVNRLLRRNFFHRNHASRMLRFEYLGHVQNSFRLRVQAQDGIAQRDNERLLARETFAAQDRVAEPVLRALPRIAEMRLIAVEPDRFQQILLVRRAQRADQLRVGVEMILDGGLVAASDKKNLVDVVRNQ